MTPDEFRYAVMARGVRVPRPFHFRWLLPALCSDDARYWRWVQWASLLICSSLVGVYTGIWWTCLIPLGLSGLLFNLKHPMLVDLPSMACALSAAVAWDHKMWWLAVLLACVASMIKESGSVFAALYAWTPVLLVGLLPVLVRAFWRTGPDPIPDGPAAEALKHPVRVSFEHHKALPLWVYVLPWGVLLAGLANPSPQLWVTLGVAYAQLLVATDAVRLYVWCFPVLALAAAPVLGPWTLVALVLHLANPFKTEGL